MSEEKSNPKPSHFILDKANIAFISIDEQSRILHWNGYATKLFGWKVEEVIGQCIYDLIIPPQFRKSHQEGMKKYITDKTDTVLQKTLEVTALHKTKGQFIIELNIFPTKINQTYTFHAFIRDISMGKTVEATSNKILEATPDAMIIINQEGKITFLNAQTEKLFGYSKEELLGQEVELLIPEPYRHRHPQHRKEFFNTPRTRPMGIGMELYGQRKDKSIFAIEISLSPLEITGGMLALAAIRDITERKLKENEILYLSSHDTLTKLHNRSAFEEALKNEINISKLNKNHFAILLLDLDNFKSINDNFGHHIGDQLLVCVATHLQNNVRKTDFVARLGGDEFVIIFSNISNEQNAVYVLAEKLIKCFNQPFKIENHYFHATISIGVAIWPQAGLDNTTLMKNADIALYSAKESGRNRYQLFSDEIESIFKYRAKLENNLAIAIERNEFFLVYQPQYYLPNKKIVGLEALLRWRHSELGLILPSDFIPLAEKNGLIDDIGKWALETACTQYMVWLSQNIIDDNLKLSVNISAVQLEKKSFINEFMHLIKKIKMPVHNLELELTETAVMTSMINLDSILEKLRKVGVSISIDDFGAGYSSLSRLKNLPVSSLKIDKSFIEDIDKDPDDAMIVKSIIALGKNLGLKVISEGVETKQQLDLLQKFGCHIVQGFYFGKEPLCSDDMTKLLIQQF